MEYTRDYVAGMIDHTLLKADANMYQINKLCNEAKKYHFASVCVNPCYVSTCANALRGSSVKVCTVIGFPLGATAPSVKAFETSNAIRHGADEVDMVINVGAVKSGMWDYVSDEIFEIVQVARETRLCNAEYVDKNVPSCVKKEKVIVKVIIETCLLTDEEKITVCKIAKKAGADFVKTSTGFSTGGALASDVALMRKTVGNSMGVKASGGIHTAAEAIEMIKAGASRLGVSAGVQIVEGL